MDPIFAWNLISIVFGLLIGSFLNVVIYRLAKDESIVRPGSKCRNCGKALRAWENIPVLSYLFLRGRCAGCKNPISFRYPLVELLTALLFLLAVHRNGMDWLLWVRDWPFLALCIAITFIDWDERIIPDELSIGGMVLGLATCYWAREADWTNYVWGAGIGFGVFFLFAWVYEKATGRSGLGGGDVKLLGMLGAFLGVEGVFFTILLSSVLGSLIGILWGILSRRDKIMQTAIPYGPFLVVGALFYYFLKDWIWLQFTIPT